MTHHIEDQGEFVLDMSDTIRHIEPCRKNEYGDYRGRESSI